MKLLRKIWIQIKKSTRIKLVNLAGVRIELINTADNSENYCLLNSNIYQYIPSFDS